MHASPSVLTRTVSRTVRVEFDEHEAPEVKLEYRQKPEAKATIIRLGWTWSTERDGWDLTSVHVTAFPVLKDGSLGKSSTSWAPFRLHERKNRPAWLQALVTEHAPRTLVTFEEVAV